MANIFKGVGISFGTAGLGVTEFGTFQLQSYDHDYKTDTEEVKDGNGITVAKVFYNQMETASFEYIPTSTSGGANSPTLPVNGDKFTITNTTADTNIAGTNWLVDDVSTKSSNTSAMKVTVKASRYPSIT